MSAPPPPGLPGTPAYTGCGKMHPAAADATAIAALFASAALARQRRPHELLLSASAPQPSPELARRRRMGKAAYEAAMVARGLAPKQARVFASAHWIFRGL